MVFLEYIMEDFKTLLESNDVNSLNRLAATRKIDINEIISDYKEIPPSLYTDVSLIHGLGVFCRTPITAHQLIENVNIIPLEFTSKYHKDNTILNYCYAFPEDSEESKKHGFKLFMFTGFGMMYNHQQKTICNARWLWDIANMEAKIFAIKPIQPKEEITIDYGLGYWSRVNGN